MSRTVAIGMQNFEKIILITVFMSIRQALSKNGGKTWTVSRSSCAQDGLARP